MRKKISGVSITQYTIVIALVAMLAAGVYYFLGKTITDCLSGYISGYDSMNKSINLNTLDALSSSIAEGKLVAGSLNGKPEDPIRKCAGEVCAIDYGDFVLNGIPENYQSMIETSGTAGTEKILSMMQQVIDQMKSDPAKASQVYTLEKLMQRGKDIISVEKNIEKFYNDVKPELLTIAKQRDEVLTKYKNGEISTLDYSSILSDNNYNGITTKAGLPEYMTSVPLTGIPFNVNMKVYDACQLLEPGYIQGIGANGDIMGGGGSSGAAYTFENFMNGSVVIPEIGSVWSAGSVAYARSPMTEYIVELKNLKSMPNVSPAIDSLTTSLSEEIYNIAINARTKGNFASGDYYDNIYNDNMSLQELTTGSPTKTTRLDLKIICSANRGQYNPDNSTCSQ